MALHFASYNEYHKIRRRVILRVVLNGTLKWAKPAIPIYKEFINTQNKKETQYTNEQIRVTGDTNKSWNRIEDEQYCRL